VIRELLAEVGDVRYVWRHLPLSDVHPQAQLAAEATEAAALQDRFWEMHDRLITHQDELKIRQILEHAEAIGLDMEQFRAAIHKRKGAGHIAEDVDSADLSGVSGTPSFFINGHRHQGAYDVDTLTKAVKLARARAVLQT
jgi:protein-disulfide isomerase